MNPDQPNLPPEHDHVAPPIVPIFRRYWWLILIFVVSFAAALNNWLFLYLRQLVYLPLLISGCVLSALGIRNVVFRGSADADVDSGWFTAAWKALDPQWRVTLTVVIFLVLFLGSCWIAAALI